MRYLRLLLFIIAASTAMPRLTAQDEERVKPLLVMITAEFDGGDRKPGAGIIFAHRNNRLYIATSLHVVRQNASAPKAIRARLHWLTGESFSAKLADHADSAIDLAVLIMENSEKLNVPKLPFEGLSREATSLKRRDEVFPMGFPEEEPWYSPPDSDKVDRVEGDDIRFQAKNLRGGYSGGGLFDVQWRLVGMLREDSALKGRATAWERIDRQLRTWLYTVELGRAAVARESAADPREPITRPSKPVQPTPGEVRLNKDDGLPYVWIPPGEFTMGCSPNDRECQDDEKPPVPGVRISKGFWMGQTEVTVEAYRRFATANRITLPTETRHNPGWNDGKQPIVNVSWDDAKRYCELGAKGRLPTEAEWEYAARAGTTASRHGSLDDIAWHSGNSGGAIHAVGQRTKNLWSLHDVLGNVREWVADWYEADYYKTVRTPQQKTDPKSPSAGSFRVVRGGGWVSDPIYVRVSYRYYDLPGDRSYYLGIRCAREVINP